jgi:hypothetical protein
MSIKLTSKPVVPPEHVSQLDYIQNEIVQQQARIIAQIAILQAEYCEKQMLLMRICE